MASYHLSVKPIGRATGASSVAKAAYRSGTEMTDERTGQVHDYSRKRGVLDSTVFTPVGAEWASDRAALWNAVEKAVTRKNGRLATELELALPCELGPDQQRALLGGFIRAIVDQHGVAADVAIHAPDRRRATRMTADGATVGGDERNIHAHVMVSHLAITAQGVGQKVAAFDGPAKVEAIRAAWADACNAALARAGQAARVDHRSYERQGVDKTPQRHLGPAVLELERRRAAPATDRGDQWRQVREVGQVEAQVIDLRAERERRAAQEAAQKAAEVVRQEAAARAEAERLEAAQRAAEAAEAAAAVEAERLEVAASARRGATSIFDLGNIVHATGRFAELLEQAKQRAAQQSSQPETGLFNRFAGWLGGKIEDAQAALARATAERQAAREAAERAAQRAAEVAQQRAALDQGRERLDALSARLAACDAPLQRRIKGEVASLRDWLRDGRRVEIRDGEAIIEGLGAGQKARLMRWWEQLAPVAIQVAEQQAAQPQQPQDSGQDVDDEDDWEMDDD